MRWLGRAGPPWAGILAFSNVIGSWYLASIVGRNQSQPLNLTPTSIRRHGHSRSSGLMELQVLTFETYDLNFVEVFQIGANPSTLTTGYLKVTNPNS